jgi:phage gp45-like
MTLDDLGRLLRPLRTAVANVVGRGVVQSVDDSTGLQAIQVELLPGEVRDEVEHFASYGFTSKPMAGAEAVVVFVGGRRDHGLAVGVSDRRYRLQNLSDGEVAIYNHTGARIVMRANGDIDLTPASGGKIVLAADTQVTGTLTASVDVRAGSVSLASHVHSAGALLTGASSGAPVTGVTAGPT